MLARDSESCLEENICSSLSESALSIPCESGSVLCSQDRAGSKTGITCSYPEKTTYDSPSESVLSIPCESAYVLPNRDPAETEEDLECLEVLPTPRTY